ncbi:MAG: type II toxin-antitoxin system Phd/YefM family antitoxin [Bacteroidota bacterium]
MYINLNQAIDMKKVQVNEIREHLATYLTEAERGEEFVVTRHNKPVAKLVPYESQKATLPDLEEFRKGISVEGAPMSEQVVSDRERGVSY